MKTINIKLKSSGITVGPFTITDNFGEILGKELSREDLVDGVSFKVDSNVTSVTLASTGDCTYAKTIPLANIQKTEWAFTRNETINTGCVWRHLTDEINFNKFYGVIKPYILEYPISYPYQDEIIQNIKSYTKVYQYIPKTTSIPVVHDKIAVDSIWFNKAVLYNDQQSSGILNLIPKPKNNLQNYMSYPLYGESSKTIIYTKSDNFYHYNTFWSIVKEKQIPLFVSSCKSLSIDKEVNQANMDYNIKSFKKEPLRAKDLKIRHILDNRSDAHLVSQFIITPSQISYK